MVFGSVNYLAYGAHTESVITLNLPQDSLTGRSVPLACAFACLFGCPLMLFPATLIVENKIFEPGPPNLRRKWKKNCLRTLTAFSCGIIAILGTDELEAFVSVVGAFCCTPLAMI